MTSEDKKNTLEIKKDTIENSQKHRNVITALFLCLISFFLIYTVSQTPHSGKYNNINDNGTFVLTKEGIKKDFTNTRKKLDWYSDPYCDDCIAMHEKVFKDIKGKVQNGELEVKIHELNFLAHRQTTNYSLRNSAYILGIAEYEPNRVLDALDIFYSKRFKEVWKNENNHNGFKALSSVLGLKDNTVKKVLQSQSEFEKLVDKNSRGIRYDQKMKDLSPTGSMFTPFIVPEGGKALDAEKVEDKDKVLEQITNVDENCVKVCE